MALIMKMRDERTIKLLYLNGSHMYHFKLYDDERLVSFSRKQKNQVINDAIPNSKGAKLAPLIFKRINFWVFSYLRLHLLSNHDNNSV